MQKSLVFLILGVGRLREDQNIYVETRENVFFLLCGTFNKQHNVNKRHVEILFPVRQYFTRGQVHSHGGYYQCWGMKHCKSVQTGRRRVFVGGSSITAMFNNAYMSLFLLGSFCQGVPFPQNEANAMDVVIQFAIHKLGFKISDIVVYAWSIGGFTGRWRRERYMMSTFICHECKSWYYVLPLKFCPSLCAFPFLASWAVMSYPEIQSIVLDASFDDLLPLALKVMPDSWSESTSIKVLNTFFFFV